jgi:hypothetical protein
LNDNVYSATQTITQSPLLEKSKKEDVTTYTVRVINGPLKLENINNPVPISSNILAENDPDRVLAESVMQSILIDNPTFQFNVSFKDYNDPMK